MDHSDGKSAVVEIALHDAKFFAPWAADKWKIPAKDGDRIETTAVGHLTRFAAVALDSLGQKIPTLGPATGERRVVATHCNLAALLKDFPSDAASGASR